MGTKTYRELVIEGDDEVLQGFIDGFKTARKIKTGLILASEHPVNTHHLKEILAFHPNYLHVIVSGRHHRSLLSAIVKTPQIQCKIISDEEITGAHFKFKFETFSRDVAKKLKQVLRKLPVGLELVDYEPKETLDPSGEGIEFYSPVHDYTFAGKGAIRGDIEKLIRFHGRTAEHVFFEADDIEIEH